MRVPLRSCAPAIVTLTLVLTTAVAEAQGICSLFACFGSRCGGGCEPGCGMEPSCGCGVGCGVDGRQFAGQAWDCCNEAGPRWCSCKDDCGNCSPGGCGPASCGCEPTCGAEPSCGCSSECNNGSSRCCLFDCLFGCTGCSSELYWCEWHNDPPRCHQPCDCYGNWIGPSAGYRAPYDHPYAVHGGAATPYYANQRGATSSTYARTPVAGRTQAIADRGVASPASPRVAQTYPANRTTRNAPVTPPAPIARRPGTSMNRPAQR